MTVTEESKTWLLTRNNVQEQEECNRTEADTRRVLHAAQCQNAVTVRDTDTDILILLCFAYSKCKPDHDWVMKVDDRYISVREVVNYIGDEVCQVLPAYHSITGCDITSYPFGTGKIKLFKKMQQQDKCHLLSKLCESVDSVNDIRDAKLFFRIRMYSGAELETHVETRSICTYYKQTIKSSAGIIPDESSTEEHVKRSDLQALIWRQCLQCTIDYPGIAGKGWQRSAEVRIRPAWYSCGPLPPSHSKKSRKSQKRGKPCPSHPFFLCPFKFHSFYNIDQVHLAIFYLCRH